MNHFGFIETPYRIVGLIDFKDAKGNIVKIPEAKWHFGIFKAFVHDPHLFLELELSKKQIDSVRMNLDIKQRDLFEGFVNKVFAFKDAEGNVTYYRNGFTVDDFNGKADYEQVGTVVEQIVSDSRANIRTSCVRTASNSTTPKPNVSTSWTWPRCRSCLWLLVLFRSSNTMTLTVH